MKLICVSGSSGVGKTTVSRLIQSVVGTNDCLILSGDDLHRWERSSPMWDTTTHLNPSSNDLETGHAHIVSLLSGDCINRKHYNHNSGKFEIPVNVCPRKYLIYTGLHALYYDKTTKYSDLNIFVDTDEKLKTEWKLTRDTRNRGYSESQVIETIKRRKKDEELYILPQKEKADIIVKFAKRNDNTISFEYISVTGRGGELLNYVKEFYDCMTEFLNLCKWLSLDPSLVQGKGGNISVKSASGLIIKASGARMADITLNNWYCLCNLSQDFPFFDNEIDYMKYVNSSKKTGDRRPSMETGFHALLPHKVIVHTHPTHLNAILCSKEARSLINEIFHDFSFDIIEYTRPGVDLVNRIRGTTGIVFLENHGLIVGADTAQEAFETSEQINSRCRRWLANHLETIVDLDENVHVIKPLFPDAAVLSQEMASINNYILRLMTAACLTPKFLDEIEVSALVGMASEQYRRSLS